MKNWVRVTHLIRDRLASEVKRRKIRQCLLGEADLAFGKTLKITCTMENVGNIKDGESGLE